MAGASDFVFNRGPTVADYPQANFDWIGNLPNAYLQGQQQQLALRGLGIQNRLANQFLGGGQQQGGQEQFTDPLAGGPDVNSSLKHAVYGQESNYGQNPSTSQTGNIGPMQISKELFGIHALPGESIYDNVDNKRVGDRILDKYMAKYNGDWRRAAVAYYSGEGNVAPPGSDTPWIKDKRPRPGVAGPTTSGYVQQIGRRMAQGTRVASTDRSFAPSISGDGSVVGSSGGSAPGANRSDQLNPQDRAAVDQMYPPARTPTNTQTQPNGGLGGETSPPAAAPGASGESPQPYQMAGQPTARQTNGAAPMQVAQAAPARNEAAAAQLPPQWRGHEQEAVQRLDQAINATQEQLKQRGNVSFKFGGMEIKTPTADLENRLKVLQDRRDKLLDAIKEGNAPTTAEKEFSNPAVQRGKDIAQVNTEEIKQGQALFKGMAQDDRSFQTNLKPIIQLGKSLVNDPKFYSGTGAERVLDINRAVASLGGDPRGAQLMEMFQKLRSQNVLQVIQAQKDEAAEIGGNSGRMYAQTIQTLEKAIPGLETSKNGVRALMEIEERIGDFHAQIVQRARTYLAEKQQRGEPAYLDRAFDERMEKFLKNNSPFTDKELQHPELLGAPTAPAGLKTKADYTNWGASLGLRPGEAFRTSTGNIRPLP